MKQSAINQARDFKAKSDGKEQEFKSLPSNSAETGRPLNNNLGRKKSNFPGNIFQSSDNILIILLIILLMDDKENFPLVFAMLYLVI